MPILWRYLVSQFLKLFAFTTVALVLCLLTLRMEEIAHFLSIDSSRSYVLSFVAYQIPYILPIAIPLGCLIGAMILMKQLSENQEISAMRALGFSLFSLITPILLTAGVIAIFNFWLTSELATETHRKTSLLKTELKSLNPLLVLHNKHLLKTRGLFFETLGQSKMGELAKDVIVAIPSKERLNLFLAKKIEAKEDSFRGEHLTFITAQDDKVLIENIGETRSLSEDFADLVQKKVWALNDDYLNFKHLKLRLKDLDLDNSLDVKKTARAKSRIYSEMARRLSLGLSAFTFTLMGLSFGLQQGRHVSKRGLIWVSLLAALFLTTFFLAKGINHKLEATLLLYFVPHLLIILASLSNLRRQT